MSVNLDKLMELTPRLTDLALRGHRSNYIEYDVLGGSVFGFSLFTKPGVSVMRAFLSKGSTVPEHSHEEREWMLVYEGCMTFHFGGQEKICHVGDGVFFDADEPHSAEMLEDTWMIAVTIPAGGGYPGNPGNPGNPGHAANPDYDGWVRWGQHVLEELKRNSGEHKEMNNRDRELLSLVSEMRVEMRAELAALKVKAGYWGAVAGAIPAGVAILLSLLT